MSYTLQSGTIYLKNLRFHAYHGVQPQERQVGNDYILNLEVDYPLSAPCGNDNVADTLSYADALVIVQREMQQPSSLLEHVSARICTAVLDAFTAATAVRIDLMKVAPPMPIDGAGAGVRLEMRR